MQCCSVVVRVEFICIANSYKNGSALCHYLSGPVQAHPLGPTGPPHENYHEQITNPVKALCVSMSIRIEFIIGRNGKLPQRFYIYWDNCMQADIKTMF